MASPDLTGTQVMNISAALLNDPNKTKYTFAVQLPYLKLALQELREHYALNNIPVTQLVSAVIPVDANEFQVVYNGAGTKTLPSDMVEPAQVWESTRSLNQWVPMIKKDYLPHSLENAQISQLVYYVWENNAIKFLPANAANDIKIDYIRELFSNIDTLDENTALAVINARSFLEYRTAGLVAEFIERNITSANSLNAYAILGSDRATGIGVKGKQNIFTRRKPFRAGYKKRGWVT